MHFTSFSNSQLLLKIHFAPGPLEIFKTLQPCPCHALKSLQRKGITQLGLRPWGWRGSADSGETGGAPGRARAWGGVHAHQGPLTLRTWAGRHSSTAHGGDGRGGRDSGETGARSGPHAMLGAQGGLWTASKRFGG
jgi:hypothetical protein